jgi:hypothetical protein
MPVNAATVCSIGETIYIFGGRTGLTEDEGPTNDIYSFNTKSNKWSKLETSGDHPLARSYHAPLRPIGTSPLVSSLYHTPACKYTFF